VCERERELYEELLHNGGSRASPAHRLCITMLPSGIYAAIRIAGQRQQVDAEVSFDTARSLLTLLGNMVI
jgi:hypothetical protein